MTAAQAHVRAIVLMVVVTVLWSTAGVVTRHLQSAAGLETTFWRSLAAAVFVGAWLVSRPGGLLGALRAGGWPGVISGAMWCAMFSCFMLAVLRTTVANTLVVLSVTPLLTALLTWVVLRQRIAPKTWTAIAVAAAGIVTMFASAFEADGGRHVSGMLIALGVPVASAINVVMLKRVGGAQDLVPAVFLGGIMSAALMLVLMWAMGGQPFQASPHDLLLLTLLGFFQLGLPCMLMVVASRHLAAPELSLLALLEVLLGPLWAWWLAGEVPATATLIGGAIVLTALVFNELTSTRRAGLAR